MYAISFEFGQATLRGNRLNNNTGGPYEFTDSLMGQITPIQDIDSSNLVDGKPTYYWVNQHNKAVPTDAGVVILINCSYITVSGLHIDKGGKYNSYSIYLVDTTNSIISDNTITEGNGIRIQENKIKGSNVSVLRNYLTTGMYTGCNTTIASNTFIGKGIRLGLVGGNYWSDYTGHDTNNDGFGDTAYHVIENYYDQYPIVQKTNTVQPSSENLNPTEKTNSPTPTNSVNPTDNPMSASTQNPLSSQEPNQTNPDTLNQQLPWVLAITGIGIISVILVTLRLHRNRKPQTAQQ